MGLQERFSAFASLGAEWVLWLLVVLSVVSFAIILERAFVLFSSRIHAAALQEKFRKLLRDDDLEGAKNALAAANSFESRVVQAGLEVAEQGSEAVAERLEGATKVARHAMEKNIAFLGTVGNNAPFVGLFGTVIGILNAFKELNKSKGQVSETLMSEIGEALVATAIGILVALPAVACFNYFNRVIKGRLVWSGALGHDLLSHLKGESGAVQRPIKSKNDSDPNGSAGDKN